MPLEYAFSLRKGISVDDAVMLVQKCIGDKLIVLDRQKDMFLAEMDANTFCHYFRNEHGDTAIPQELSDYVRFVEANLVYKHL